MIEASRSSEAPAPSTSNRLVDRHLDCLENSVQDIRRAIETPGLEKYALKNYLAEIVSLKEELQGLKREILSLDYYQDSNERASQIERFCLMRE